MFEPLRLMSLIVWQAVLCLEFILICRQYFADFCHESVGIVLLKHNLPKKSRHPLEV
jgi:hypothetical protein